MWAIRLLHDTYVDAKSILSVLALDARGGDEVVLAAAGEGLKPP